MNNFPSDIVEKGYFDITSYQLVRSDFIGAEYASGELHLANVN
ncbi:MAG TPA: hypothetical protein VNS32_02420 [Flavisolibacter sp.]|nr:hypothetical protein [Flavisolibacter sp.]